MVVSIIALMKSNEVNNMLQLGDNTGFLRAQEASNTAKTLNIISSVLLGIGVIGSIIYVLVVGVANITQSLNNF
jgi:hypothetical protein